jgi:hypothetical protein
METTAPSGVTAGMRRVRVPLIASTMIVMIAACGERSPVAENAATVNLPVAASAPEPHPLGGPPANAVATPVQPAVAAGATATTTIPDALQGRWALTPPDCTSALGDAKGLLVISADELRFYESRAVPSPGIQSDSDSVTGNFHFTGEGQSWTKFEKIERRKNTLVRTESNPAASYTYAKC